MPVSWAQAMSADPRPMSTARRRAACAVVTLALAGVPLALMAPLPLFLLLMGPA